MDWNNEPGEEPKRMALQASTHLAPREEPFVKELHFISKDYFGAVSHRLAHTDLDRNFYTLLLVCRHKKGLTQKDLGEMIEVDKVTMSRKIDYLASLGYLTREPNPDDRRTILLKPTRKALSLAGEISEAYVSLNKLAFRGIDTAEQKAFLATAAKLRRNMADLPRAGVKVEYKQKTGKNR